MISGCVSTEVVFKGRGAQQTKPSYEDYFDYYLFGFVGHNSVSLQKVCLDQKPYRLQTLRTGEDAIISFYTFGIYTPMTVRIWCGD